MQPIGTGIIPLPINPERGYSLRPPLWGDGFVCKDRALFLFRQMMAGEFCTFYYFDAEQGSIGAGKWADFGAKLTYFSN